MDPSPPPAAPSAAKDPKLEVSVVLAEKTAKLGEVLSLCIGSVIGFEKHSTALLDLLVSNRRIGAGKAVKSGERFGLHLGEIGTPEETLAKLR